VAGRLLADCSRAITLIKGAGVAIIRTGRSSVAGRMLADCSRAITLIKGAGVAIIRTGRAGRFEAVGRAEHTTARARRCHIAHPRRGAANRASSLELTRGGATVTVKEVAVVTLFARVKDTVATVGLDLGHKSIVD